MAVVCGRSSPGAAALALAVAMRLACCSNTPPSWPQDEVGKLLAAAWQEGRPPPPLFSYISEEHFPANLPIGPTIAPQFSAKIIYDGGFMGIKYHDGHGVMYYDGPGQRSRMTYTVTMDYFTPNMTQLQDNLNCNTSLANNQTIGAGEEAVCLVWTFFPYRDMFSWTRYALPHGSKMVGNQSCWSWELKVPIYGVDFSVCVKDGVPLQLNQSMGYGGNTLITLSDFQAGDPGSAVFEPTKACATDWPVAPCQDAEVTALDVYRIWGGPPEPLELQNRNGGDVLGDLAFVCTQATTYSNKLITHWGVRARQDFGQYALCNFDGKTNHCQGPEDMLLHVGKRSGQMAGRAPLMGQCSANEDVGSQYSFPEEAMCPPGVEPSLDSKCSWGMAQALRTVRAECVMEERGLLDACARDRGHAPFQDAVTVWLEAFADPAEGGCPEVGVEEIVI